MRARETRFLLMLLAPAGLVLLLLLGAPIVQSILLSTRRIIVALPSLGDQFVGLANYAALLHDPVAWHSLGITFLFVAVTTALELAIGLGLALLINRAFPGRGALRAVVLVPWAIPTVVAAQMWRYLFNDAYGLINAALFGSDITAYVPWLAIPNAALACLILADVWKTSAFAALLILAGLQTIPDDLYDAARVDGAGTWARFRHITWPLIRPAVLIALLFRTIDAFRVFDLAFVMTQGGPADASNVLQLYGYKKMFVEGAVGQGAAISTLVFAIVLVLALLYVRLVGRRLLEARS